MTGSSKSSVISIENLKYRIINDKVVIVQQMKISA